MIVDHVRAFSLHDQLLAARRDQRRAEFKVATLLVEMADAKLYAALGYASLLNYADLALGLSPRVARDLLALGRGIVDLPILATALQAGELDWTKAREIVRVATPETERAWVDRAQTVSCRVVESEVAFAMVGELPPEGPPDATRKPARGRVVFRMEAADAEVLRTALAVLRANSNLDGTEISDGALLAAMARTTLLNEELSNKEPGSIPTGERYRVVIEECPQCRRTTTPDAEVTGTIADEAECDAEIVEMRPGPAQGRATRTIPGTKRRIALHRAGWRCEVPRCSNKVWIDIHHLRPWAKGGGHEASNLIALCCAHHRAVHDGSLSIDRRTDGCIEVQHRDGRVFVGRNPKFPTWGDSKADRRQSRVAAGTETRDRAD